MPALPQPYWPWCPVPGASRDTKMAVDEVAFGDGYKHRSTRGLNPARPSWQLGFPFKTLDELDERDRFLRNYAVPGFWIMPPDGKRYAFVTADEWGATISDRSPTGDRLGVLTVTMTQSFNPQPDAVVVPPAPLGTSVSVGATPPLDPEDNQLWWNSSNSEGGGQLYIYFNDGSSRQWVPASALAE